MKIELKYKGQSFKADLSRPIDISIPLKNRKMELIASMHLLSKLSPWLKEILSDQPKKDGPLNFLNVHFNPHGNGTHTECVGHIAKEKFTINQCLKTFHFLAKLYQSDYEMWHKKLTYFFKNSRQKTQA